MWTYLLILVLPCILLSVALKSFWGRQITYKEMVISFGVNLLVAVISLAIFAGYAHNKMSDVEILNGIVTGQG